MNRLKKGISNWLLDYAEPVDYMYRANWLPIVDYGVNRNTLANVARNYYGDALGNVANRIGISNPLYGLVNDLQNRNIEQQRLNAMRYGGYPVYPQD